MAYTVIPTKPDGDGKKLTLVNWNTHIKGSIDYLRAVLAGTETDKISAAALAADYGGINSYATTGDANYSAGWGTHLDAWASGNAINVWLPVIAGQYGLIEVRKNDGSANAVIILTQGGQFINGSLPTLTLSSFGDSVTLRSDGTGWMVVASSPPIAGSVNTVSLADSAVTPAKIANRSRYLFIPATAFTAVVGSPALVEVITDSLMGWALDGSTEEAVATSWMLPMDCANVGNVTLEMILGNTTATAGNVKIDVFAKRLIDGDALNNAGQTAVHDTLGAPVSSIAWRYSTMLLSASTSNLHYLAIDRRADQAEDTLDGVDLYFMGVRINYTADS